MGCSYTGFLTKCHILDIRQGFEYALISEHTRVMDILEFCICQCSHGFKSNIS